MSSRTRASLAVPLSFLVIFFGYMEFGVTSIEHVTFLHKLERYIGLITPGICLIIGRVIAVRTPARAIPLVVLFLVAVTIYWLQTAGLPPWIQKGGL